jgi:uroporphyrinogen-III synthase
VARGLAAAGWRVDAVEAYRTVPAELGDAARVRATGVDVVTFASPSSVVAWVDASLPIPPLVACIGPVTADAARAAGVPVGVLADEHTAVGLVDALVRHVTEGG